MKKITFTLILLILVVLALSYGCSSLDPAALQAAQATPTPLPPVSAASTIVAEGRLLPVRWLSFGFQSSGTLDEVLVKDGQQVQAGDVIARLGEQEQLQAAVAAAQFELVSAQQALEKLDDHTGMSAAQAQLDLANARDALRVAEYNLRVNQKGQRASQGTIDAAQARLILAEDAVKAAEGEYNNLTHLTHDDPQRAAALTRLAAARQNRDAALGTLNWYKGEPTELQLALLVAEVAIAQAQVDEAQVRLDTYQKGADPDDVILAEARISNAQAQLSAAQAAFDNLVLKAPFSGTITQLDLQVGQFVSAATPSITLVDFSSWKIETTDMSEINVVHIRPESPVTVAFDALPEVEFAGRVSEIKPFGENRQGEIVYKVIVLPESSPDWEDWKDSLLWNMTAVVTIDKRQ